MHVRIQVLITQSDFLSRERYSYLTDTLERLMQLGVTPIINENDVVTGCSELDTQRVFSDNDKLSALVAAGSDADGLALLTDVEAVYDQWGTRNARRIKSAAPDRLSMRTFAEGSMGPKVAAGCRFAKLSGGLAGIGRLADAGAILRGEAGTVISTRHDGLQLMDA